jgi:hypothetical protein
MFIYNVTVKIDHAIQADWLEWMREQHIPDVMKTGQFQSHRLCKLMEQDESDGLTYAIQYLATSMSHVFTYQEKFAKKLQAEHTERYAGKFVAFRTLLRIIE